MKHDGKQLAQSLRTSRASAMALVMGLAALTAQASESDLVHDIQRYCAVCWRNARLDPGVWDDCTQEVCCRLLGKARAGELDLNLVLADDTLERRELVRAIDMVRKRVQRARKFQPLDDHLTPGPDHDRRHRDRQELGEVLEAARREVLSPPPGSDRRTLDPRLDRPRHLGQARPCRGSRVRREVQGPPQARTPPRRPPRRPQCPHRRG